MISIHNKPNICSLLLVCFPYCFYFGPMDLFILFNFIFESLFHPFTFILYTLHYILCFTIDLLYSIFSHLLFVSLILLFPFFLKSLFIIIIIIYIFIFILILILILILLIIVIIINLIMIS